MVAFERFLARLVTVQAGAWALKGGLALQFHLGERARTTQDIDLLPREMLSAAGVHRRLVTAALMDLGDWFLFEAPISYRRISHLRPSPGSALFSELPGKPG